MELKYQMPMGLGFYSTQNVKTLYSLKYLSFDFLRLQEGEKFLFHYTQDEVALVIISGHVWFQTQAFESELKRHSVFTESASVLYVPPRLQVQLRGLKDSFIAFCRSKSEKKEGDYHPFLVKPGEGCEKVVGRDLYQRKVTTLLSQDHACEHLILGETLNQAGCWSSFPPHKHDHEKLDIETEMEEVYFFKVNPPNGFGFQRVYTDDRTIDCAITVQDESVVLIPKGYHPVCAMPGYEIYYLWFLAGKNRKLLPYTDPNFKWLETSQNRV